MRTLKNYRFTDETIEQLENLQKASGKSATDILESLIQIADEELAAARSGEEHDEILIARVVGRKVRRARTLVKTVS
jgi:hypothetical protein